jgi:RND family efflux transporter MFP subunit
MSWTIEMSPLLPGPVMWAAVAVARAAVQVRERELEDLVVRAPFGGVVVFKDAQPGEMVSPISAGGGYTRTGIASVVDMQSLEIHVDVNEAYLNRVAEGQLAEAVLDAYPDWKIAARVRAIVPTADRQKATVRVRVAFDALDSRILPDMGAKVRFLSQSDAGGPPPVAVVPAGAVMERAGEASVWRVEEGVATRVAVRVGAEAEGRRAILAGVAPGDRLVLDPPDTLTEGAAVSPREPD